MDHKKKINKIAKTNGHMLTNHGSKSLSRFQFGRFEMPIEKRDELTDSITRCVCGFLHDDGFMICCDRCNVWQHCICLGMSKDSIPDEYFCERCIPRTVDVQRAKLAQCRSAAEKGFDVTCPTDLSKSFQSNSSNFSFESHSSTVSGSLSPKINMGNVHNSVEFTMLKSSVQTSQKNADIGKDANTDLKTSSFLLGSSKSRNSKDFNAERNPKEASDMILKDKGIEAVPVVNPVGVHDPTDKKTWLCSICKHPDPEQETVKKNAAKGPQNKLSISVASNYVAIDKVTEMVLPFARKEEVFSFDGPWIYKATILNIHSDDKKAVWYNLHYDAWPDQDTCVTSKRLLKINEQTLNIKSRLDILTSLKKSSKEMRITNSLNAGNDSFRKGQKVIVYFGGYLYLGLILDSKMEKSADKTTLLATYQIHYNGWNKQWDEWVPAERIFECTSLNEEIRIKMETYCNTGNKPAKLQKIADTIAVHDQCKSNGRKNAVVIKGNTEWICCSCNRWFHKVCTGFVNLKTSFSCSKVGMECLPRKDTSCKQVETEKKVFDELELSAKKMKRETPKMKIKNKDQNGKGTRKTTNKNQYPCLVPSWKDKQLAIIKEENDKVEETKCKEEIKAPAELYGKVKNANMIVCCVCLQIVYSQNDMDQHYAKYHHIEN